VVVARRLCLDQYRERYGRPRGEGIVSADATVARRRIEDLLVSELDLAQVPDASASDPAETIDGESRRRALRNAVATLQSADRLLLQLRFEHDLPAREIAGLLHFQTPFHVYRRLNAVLATLRVALVRRGVASLD
jgi:RNA polymerase sigma factor (sigma-70 family)